MAITTHANITPHINTGELRDESRVKALLASPHIHVAYLLGDHRGWIDYALAQPNIKLVVVRRWNPFGYPNAHDTDIDGQLHQLKTPEEVFTSFLSKKHTMYQGNPRVRWIYGWNEPSAHPTDPSRDLLQLNTWMAKVGELFAQNGYGAALGGYAAAKTNSLPIKDVAKWRKAWKLVLDVLAKYPDWLHLDWHEYEYAFMPINYLTGINTPFPFSFLDKQITDPEHWGTIPYEGAGIQHNWKLGNIANIMEYNRELGHAPFQWGRGEWGTDTMTENWWFNNSIDGKKPLEQTWREMFGITAKGVHTLFKYHAYLHDKPNTWTMAEHNAFIIKQAEWFKKNSGEGCLYNAHFAWNTNSKWRTEDISHPDYAPYIYWMSHQQDTVTIPTPQPDPTPTPEPTFTEVRVQSTSADGQNIRRAPVITPDNFVAKLPPPPATVMVSVSDAPVIDPDGLQWREIKYGTIRGYVAWKYIKVVTEPNYRKWFEEDLLRQRQALVEEIAEKTEALLQVDHKLELLRAS